MGLDSVELVLAVEEHFGVHIPDGELVRITTVGEYHTAILGKLGVLAATPEAAAIWERLVDVIVEQSAVDRRKVLPGVRIARDLGID